MSIAEGYIIDVQCDACLNPRAPARAQFTGDMRSRAMRALTRAGWHVSPILRKATCPRCIERAVPGDP